MTRVAIFNSFPFHYEMFGYIINYCINRRFELTIYTTRQNEMGWIHFYSRLFQKGIPNFFPFFVKPIQLFNVEFHQYDLIVLTTDDDRGFKDEWISEKVVKISHVNFERRPQILNTIYNRPYDIRMPWALPCFPIVNVDDKLSKMKFSEDAIDIVLIGDYMTYQFNIFNRMQCVDNSDKKIILHFVNRRPLPFQTSCRDLLNGNISTKFHVNLNTDDLFNLILDANYLCIECSSQPKHYHNSMSGTIPLAFSCLTPLIIDKKMNAYYKFQNVVEYDISGTEPIILSSGENYESMVLNLESERDVLTGMLATELDGFFIKNEDKSVGLEPILKYDRCTHTALIVEPRKLDRLHGIIKQYRIVLGDTWKIVFYCGRGLKQYWSPLLEGACVEVRELDVDNLNSNQYNDFLKTRELWESFSSNYVLVFQSDSWIHFDPIYNIDFFIDLNKSYIGGNMSYHWNELLRENIHISCRNFNGGLSLRKRKDMLAIIERFPPKPTIICSTCMETDAEDVYFTIGAHNLGFAIGDEEQCSHFAVHTIFKERWFGTHSPNYIVKPLLLKDFPEIKIIY